MSQQSVVNERLMPNMRETLADNLGPVAVMQKIKQKHRWERLHMSVCFLCRNAYLSPRLRFENLYGRPSSSSEWTNAHGRQAATQPSLY